MSFDLFLAILGFAFVTSVTPGPNNMMLLSSGVNFGLRATIPHMLGVSLGHALMTLLVGLGLSGLFHAYPQLLTGLKVVSVLYMIWLAWKIATAAAPDASGRQTGRPLSFLQASLFQWVNPKGWMMTIGATAAYLPEPSALSCALLAGTFIIAGTPAILIWTVLGQGLRRWLESPLRLRLFNGTMAVLLLASLWPVLTMTVGAETAGVAAP